MFSVPHQAETKRAVARTTEYKPLAWSFRNLASPMASTAVVYKSIHHQNTRRIAEVIAAELKADLLTVEEATQRDGGTYDLVGFGSGVYFWRHHGTVRQLIKTWCRVPRESFVFSTAGIPALAFIWNGNLARALRKRGSHVLGQFCCAGWDSVGPLWLLGGIQRGHPNADDCDRAATFARTIRTHHST